MTLIMKIFTLNTVHSAQCNAGRLTNTRHSNRADYSCTSFSTDYSCVPFLALRTKITKCFNTILMMTALAVFLAACGGGGGGGGGGSTPGVKPPPAGISLLNLRIIPDVTNATLIWDNPDAEIASINITYHNKSTPDVLQYFPLITDGPTIVRNTTDVREMIPEGSLTRNTIYTFRVALEFEGADANKSIIAEDITRLMGPNLDQDDLADAVDKDDDGDGVNDEQDAFPRNAALFGFGVTELTATPGNSSVTLSWTNPVANISSISISYKRTGTNDSPPPVISTQTAPGIQNVQETITGLDYGQSYNFTVSLTLDRDDEGKRVSAASIPATTNLLTVTGLEADSGTGEVTLNWNNPNARIASINISYQVTGSNDVQYWGLITTPADIRPNEMNVQQTISGLTNEEPYTFTVSLTLEGNDAGKGGTAPPVSAIPSVFAVTELTARPGDSNVNLNWKNPNAPIASINISYRITGSDNLLTKLPITDRAKIAANASNVQQTISGLSNEISYTFTVSLTLEGNDAGKERATPPITIDVGPDDNGNGRADFLDDDDGDSIANYLDVDSNGNGLIEIATAEELNQVRANLTGRSFAGDSMGCGGQTGITACNGYELIANISLANYADWKPIGSCSRFNSVFQCVGVDALFNATFNGNGYIINNLTITGGYPNETGLFGAISPTSIMRNVHIRSANITGAVRNVGILIGYAEYATISHSSAEGEVAASGNHVGALVGDGYGVTIMASYANSVSVSGNNRVGGLVGEGVLATITTSYANSGSVSGVDRVGGLVGSTGGNTTIMASYANSVSVSGRNNVGGLIGDVDGETSPVTITSSYAVSGSVSGVDRVGGLVGSQHDSDPMITITDSYWNNETNGVTKTIGNTAGTSEGRSTEGLQNSTNIVPDVIYETWITETCPDSMTMAWDFGNSTQYPALTCTYGDVDVQRP